jgi:serine/threonine-protein kinase
VASQRDDYPQIILTGTDPDLPTDLDGNYAKYSDFQEMARGGKALLRSCWDSVMGRTVALKSLLPRFASDLRERRRFLREARVTAQLQHPNTVPVYEIGYDDQQCLYFTMKRIAGENLFQILQRLSWRDAVTLRQYPLSVLLDVVTQACQALAYAHAHGVIHRDVKPENIWLGKFGEVILLDWGVSKVWGAPEDVTEDTEPHEPTIDRSSPDQLQTLTLAGQRPGTPLYMSPEQVLGNRYLDERTDVFSMGVLMYEMLTFQEPFRGRTINDTFDRIVHDDPPPFRTHATDRDLPQGLESIVFKAVSKDPADRFQHVLDLIGEVRSVRGSLGSA